jgi:hypothetical protein
MKIRNEQSHPRKKANNMRGLLEVIEIIKNEKKQLVYLIA